MRIALACVLVSLLSASPMVRAQDGNLRKVRDEVNAAPAQQRAGGEEDDDADSWIGELIGGAVKGCFWMLAEAFQLEEADDGTPLARFRRYPYADGGLGLMAMPSTGMPPKHTAASDDWRGSPPCAHEAPALHRCSWRVLLEDSNDFTGVNRVNGQVLVETSSRLGVQAGWCYLHECLAGGGHDRLTLGDAALTFRFLESENLLLRMGVGFRWLADNDNSFGVNLLAAGDYFPVKPVVISACIDGGNLGSASVLHLRGTAGIVYRHYEFFTGYDWLRIGSVNFYGPVAGLRLWF